MAHKILIVDDLKPFIEKERSILDREDFIIFTATSGAEALDVHRKEKVDLIIIDLDMPEMAGDELARKVREDKALRQVSILMVCTVKSTDVERATNCGANAYITRPLKPEEFFNKVVSILDVPHRTSYRVLLKLTVKNAFQNEPFFSTSKDISKSGILLESEKILAKGDKIECSFFLPDGDRIVTEGEVARVSKTDDKAFQYGIKFTEIRPVDMASIEEFVNRMSLKHK